MTVSAIRIKLSDYIQTADEKIIRALYTLLEKDIEENKSISIEKYNQELEEAEKEYENGKYISHEEMTERIKRW